MRVERARLEDANSFGIEDAVLPLTLPSPQGGEENLKLEMMYAQIED
jgi:hypothetical protein